MTTSEFEQFVAGNAKMGLSDEAYSVIGLCGEAGEVAEWYKKAVMRGKDIDEVELFLELGDVLHYLTRIAVNRGYTLEEVMTSNVAKLKARGEWS